MADWLLISLLTEGHNHVHNPPVNIKHKKYAYAVVPTRIVLEFYDF